MAPRDDEYVDQIFRIEEIKGQIAEQSEGEMVMFEDPDCPPDMALQFWEYLAAFESAEQTTHRALLERDGVTLASPDDMDDALLSAKLYEVIHALAKRSTFLDCTDHMSDRELYTRLWSDTLDEWTPDFPPMPGAYCHIDFHSGSEEDTKIWLTYYASDTCREQWQKDFPEYLMPPHADPPYDRDRFLPTPPDPFDDEEYEDDEE